MNSIDNLSVMSTISISRNVHFGENEIRIVDKNSWIPRRADDPFVASLIENRIKRAESTSSSDGPPLKSILKKSHNQESYSKSEQLCCVIS